ncbi:class I SAM-dependent methyltransferase [Streptomyces sp. NPDC002499]
MTTPTTTSTLSETLAFLRQFTRTAKMTGAVVPSGSTLAQALTRHVQPGTRQHPRAVLEVGPGTGAVTRHLARRLGPHDTLELVEANAQFAARLEWLLQYDPQLARASSRIRLHHGLIQDQQIGQYDTIVCGLPFANFPPRQVDAIARQLLTSLRPGGRLSFFSYLGGGALRRVNARQALSHRALHEVIGPYVVGSEIVLPNLPPAHVHHILAPVPITCRCGAPQVRSESLRQSPTGPELTVWPAAIAAS